MILFYKKKTGEIIGTIDGRVHDEIHQKCSIDDGSGEEIGSFIVGWTEKDCKRIEHNMKHFELLQEFESISKITPMCYNVINNDLVKRSQ